MGNRQCSCGNHYNPNRVYSPNRNDGTTCQASADSPFSASKIPLDLPSLSDNSPTTLSLCKQHSPGAKPFPSDRRVSNPLSISLNPIPAKGNRKSVVIKSRDACQSSQKVLQEWESDPCPRAASCHPAQLCMRCSAVPVCIGNRFVRARGSARPQAKCTEPE